MPVTSGARLGPYEILSVVGVGGMGEVYRARDTRLDRDVAIKILPETFTADAERVARFQREAKILASLNHQNIATIYGLEEADGGHALVMELVEGQDLAQRIGRGAIPLDEALPIAKQIADALEAAHEQGIIHRDLKPANIKVRPDNAVKVLDFGLAKAVEPVAGIDGEVTTSPTITSPAMTRAGGILGTAAYMSPEQAKGRLADKRSDIWAFGVVLYEMLSGQRVFKGDDVGDTLAAVLRAEPSWASLPQDTPQAIRKLLRRCLQKDPTRRLQHIGDVRLELAELALGGGESLSIAAEPSQRRVWPLVAAAAIGAVVTGLTAWLLVTPRPVARPVTRFAIQAPASALLAGRFTGYGGGIAFSPDGRTLVYAGGTGSSVLGLVKRQLDDLSVEPVRGTENGHWPFFSPDGTWIGFFADGKLKKVPAGGGQAVVLCDAPVNARATWGDDDTIILARTHLYKVSANGGALEMILESDFSTQFSEPVFLPGSKAVLVRARMPPAVGRIEAVDLQARTRHTLVEGSSPKLAPTGDLLFVREGRLWTTKFDSKQLAAVGTPVPLVESVGLVDDEALFTVSRDGSLAYLSGAAEATTSLVWLDRTGKWTLALEEHRRFLYPRLSPDDKRVAVSIATGAELDLWTFELERGSGLRLTTDGNNRRNEWSPDGTQIAFFSVPTAPEQGVDQDLFVMSSSGGKPRRLLARPGPQWPDSWSPDGRFLVFEEGPGGASRDLWLLPFGADPRPLVVTRFNERGAVFSPNGRWLAFVTDESGRAEVYIQPFPGPGPKVSISNNGGVQPVWARNGRELFYREGDALIAVPVQFDPFRIGARQKVFDFPGALYNSDPFMAQYDVTADGRFLAVRREGRATEEIHVVLNWTEELRQRLGR